MSIIPKPQKNHAEKMLAPVSVDTAFLARNGARIHSLDELLAALKNMDDDTFRHHVNEEKNDFKNWILDIIHDDTLADKLVLTKHKEVMIALVRERIEFYESIVSDVREEKKFVKKKEPLPPKVSLLASPSPVKKIALPSIKKLTYTPIKKGPLLKLLVKSSVSAVSSSKRSFASPVSRSSLSSQGTVVLPKLREKQVKIRSKLLQKKLDSIPLQKPVQKLSAKSVSLPLPPMKKSVIVKEQKEKESDIADIVSTKKIADSKTNFKDTMSTKISQISSPMPALASAESLAVKNPVPLLSKIAPGLFAVSSSTPNTPSTGVPVSGVHQAPVLHSFVIYFQELWHHAKASLIFGMIAGLLIGFILAYVFF